MPQLMAPSATAVRRYCPDSCHITGFRSEAQQEDRGTASEAGGWGSGPVGAGPMVSLPWGPDPADALRLTRLDVMKLATVGWGPGLRVCVVQQGPAPETLTRRRAPADPPRRHEARHGGAWVGLAHGWGGHGCKSKPLSFYSDFRKFPCCAPQPLPTPS
jgi:hypothetical protein